MFFNTSTRFGYIRSVILKRTSYVYVNRVFLVLWSSHLLISDYYSYLMYRPLLFMSIRYRSEGADSKGRVCSGDLSLLIKIPTKSLIIFTESSVKGLLLRHPVDPKDSPTVSDRFTRVKRKGPPWLRSLCGLCTRLFRVKRLTSDDPVFPETKQ